MAPRSEKAGTRKKGQKQEEEKRAAVGRLELACGFRYAGVVKNPSELSEPAVHEIRFASY